MSDRLCLFASLSTLMGSLLSGLHLLTISSFLLLIYLKSNITALLFFLARFSVE